MRKDHTRGVVTFASRRRRRSSGSRRSTNSPVSASVFDFRQRAAGAVVEERMDALRLTYEPGFKGPGK
ncbi:MAG: hypothetical protein WAX80_02215 [Minisyncoccia bacterium]